MPEIKHSAFAGYLKGLDRQEAGQGVQVYFFFGEEYLRNSLLAELVARLVPEDRKALNYDTFDASDSGIFEALERVNTFSLTPGARVFAIRDCELSSRGSAQDTQFMKAKQAWQKNESGKAARFFLGGLSRLGLTLKGASAKKIASKTDLDPSGDADWIEALIEHCVARKLKVPQAHDSRTALTRAVKKGFPGNHFLCLTADKPEKRSALFKALKEAGMVVDCLVPLTERKADKAEQEAVLRAQIESVLKPLGKRLAPDAYGVLFDYTGFSPRKFAGDLDKLASYVGARDVITAADVKAALTRTRLDPVYELTGAVAARKTDQALFYLSSLIENEFHPLQVLAALINQVRKLLTAKLFITSEEGKIWHSRAGYNEFKSRMIPAIQAYDQRLADVFTQWQAALEKQMEHKAKGTKAKSKSSKSSDLLVAKNPNNPYPVYLLLKNASRFDMGDLVQAMEILSQADLQLKTSALMPKLVLEEAVLKICSSGSGAA